MRIHTPFRWSSLVIALAAMASATTPSTAVEPPAKSGSARSKPARAERAAPALPQRLVDDAAASVAEVPLPVRKWSSNFRDLGVARPMGLRGVESEASVGVGVRRDEIVESARLTLTFTLSPSVLPNLSHLKVMLNDETVRTLVLDKDRLGTSQTVEIDLDPRYFADYNRFRFQFIGHYTLECEMPNHSSLWATVSNESRLDLTLRQLPIRNDLALLPAPFFDPRDNRPVVVPLVYGSAASMGVYKASGSLASWMGMLAGYRGNRFPVLVNQLPDRHAVVVATNASRPDFLKDLPPVERPTLMVQDHPRAPGAKLLLLLGKDDAQVQMAADALALGKAALSGQRIEVSGLVYPPATKPYDAPRWITTQRPVRLSELVSSPSDLQLRGSVLNDTVSIYTRMAPDLFTWNAKGVPLNLSYRYTPTTVSDHGTLNVSINNQFIEAYPLQSSGDRNTGKSTVLLPLFDDGNALTRSDLKIPAFMIGGDNQLQFAFQIPPNDLGRCRSSQPAELFAAIDPQSTIDLTGFRHYIAMPNLAAYANGGFPFTRMPDLAQTSVVLPNTPTAADLQIYLTAIARLSAATGYPGTRFRLVNAAQIRDVPESDLLVVSRGDSDGLLAGWHKHLPALVSAGVRSVQPLERAFGALSDLFLMEGGYRLSSSGGLATLEGDGPLAAMVGFESPLHPGRSVVALTATDDTAMDWLSKGLNDAGQIQRLRGDLSLFRAEAVESFRVQPVYYVGDLPWWQRLWFHLHGHPLILAAVGILTGLLLTFVAYGTLRAMARRRMEPDHG